ncbi:MAG: CarD family transcriptional regulator [Enterovirga sp.]|nr:CarD family transcriptional regulator [Enterovirga sp.]
MHNALLESLAPADLACLSPGLARVQLTSGQVLLSTGTPAEHVCFPEDGLVSLLSGLDGHSIETGLVGRDGLVGVAVLFGHDRMPHKAVVQLPGPAWRVSAADFRRALRQSATLHEHLLRYACDYAVQAEQTAFAAGKCTVEQRLARWLLMAQDRLNRDDVDLTHECLANTLGVRRPGVTVALHVLEGEFAIRSRRGRITIRCRERLKRLAGAAYAEPDRARQPAEPELIQAA